jgi:hypothetical protein
MEIAPRKPCKGPKEWFSGQVWIDSIVEPTEESQSGAVWVAAP